MKNALVVAACLALASPVALSAQLRTENDHLVVIALGTFGVAVAVTVVGMLGYLLRARLGLVKPPPGEGHDSHPH